MSQTKIRGPRARRERRAHHPPTAWADFMSAKKRMDAARSRLEQLADQMDDIRDDLSQALTDAGEALQRVAIPADRDAP